MRTAVSGVMPVGLSTQLPLNNQWITKEKERAMLTQINVQMAASLVLITCGSLLNTPRSSKRKIEIKPRNASQISIWWSFVYSNNKRYDKWDKIILFNSSSLITSILYFGVQPIKFSELDLIPPSVDSCCFLGQCQMVKACSPLGGLKVKCNYFISSWNV